MNNESMAKFIFELRKAKSLTQKQLAEKLKITDKAVSKWERGLGYPDITTLAKLAEILGVTTNELLNGSHDEHPLPKADIIVQSTLKYAEKVTVNNNRNIQNIIKFIITISFILAIIVCIICDLSISKGLTWSLYPIASIVFAWLVIVPIFQFQKNKIAISLFSLSIFVVPFLFCIEQIVGKTKWLIPLGIPISIVSIAYLWVVFCVIKKLQNKWYALSIAVVMASVLSLLINFIISRTISEPVFDAWDAMSIAIYTLIAAILFTIGYFSKRKQHNRFL